ncbi:HAD-IIIC family phosphatase [Pseudomonas sp. R2.Fl]|nr:HAD-IIIC family phosphatase [Pseudomonas sp. R2.Fl]
MERAVSENLRVEFLQCLRDVLPSEPGIAVLHSSLAVIAPSPTISKWDVLYALGVLAGEGWTFALPAFTFSFCRGQPFDIANSPSETGALADWLVHAFPEARRTSHPIYSFSVIGPRMEEILSCPSTTTFGDDSPFGFFDREDASVVMIGCGWEYCTLFHRFEEQAAVPYRQFKEFSGEVVKRGGAVEKASATMFVRNLDIGAINDFSKAVEALRKADAMEEVALWRGTIAATRASAVRDACMRLLSDDPLVFLSNRAEVRARLGQTKESELAPVFRVALLGSSNLDIARDQLFRRLEQLLPQRKSDVVTVPFGQLFTEIINPVSQLNQASVDLAIFCDRIEDLVGAASIDKVDMALAREKVEAYALSIAQFGARSGAWLVVHRFSALARLRMEENARIGEHVSRLNEILADALRDVKKLVWLDLASEAAQSELPYDSRLWYIGRIPFSQDLTAKLVERWAGIVLSALEKTARLVIVDLDNTLWGGVLGEDGIEGIRIGGDYPGNAFLDFQSSIKALSERGVALAICSKNDEDLALKALDTHREMALRSSDFVTHRINWKPKWENIKSIADELGLGLASVLFIDDNPVERENVARNLPEVHVLDLPVDVAHYTDSLKSCVWLESIRVGQEDLNRLESYKVRRQINEGLQKAESIADFLHSLEMQLFVDKLDESNIARASQLCLKTNQFNTTTRRYSAQDLLQLVSDGADVAVVALADKFSARENIGLLVLKQNETDRSVGDVDLFLLSCRILGRTVETTVLNWALERAKTRNWKRLNGLIVETPRNTPARGVFGDAGFDFDPEAGLWFKESGSGQVPPWFKLHSNITER